MDSQPTPEAAFVESLAGYSLSELEDIYAHLDRDAFPERFDLVQEEIQARPLRLGPDPARFERKSGSRNAELPRQQLRPG